MYSQFLFIHSWLRWLVLFLLVITLAKFSYSLITKKSYTKIDRALSSALLGSVHLQFVVGLILYFGLSPIVQQSFDNAKAAMKNSFLRYWFVEHFFSMFLFVVLIQFGFSLSKRSASSKTKHRFMLIFGFIAFVIVMINIPWPIREFGRPLFR